jgi:hypothetical protein
VPTRTTEGPATISDDLKDDCSVDVTEPFNDWLSSLPDGTEASPTVVDLAGGCYRVDGTLEITGRQWFQIRGGGATIDGSHHMGPSRYRHILVRGGAHIVVRDLVVIGAHAEAGAPGFPAWGCANERGDCHGHHGIAVQGATDVLLAGNTVRNTYGDLIYIGWDQTGRQRVASSEVVIEGNLLVKSGRQGIAAVAVDGLTVQGNTIAEARANLIDLEPADAAMPLRSVKIVNNSFGLYRVSVIALTGPGACGRYEDITIASNLVEALNTTDWPVIYGTTPPSCKEPRSGITIEANDFLADGPTVLLSNWEGLVVEGNTFRCDPCKGDVPVRLEETHGAVLHNEMPGGPEAVTAQGGEVIACGNETSIGPDQPVACGDG